MAGRPRNIENRVAILAATREVLADVGYDGLTFEAVAQQAGLYRKLINRSWASKAELVRDALFVDVPTFSLPNTGSLSGDLEAMLAQQADTMMRPEFLRGMPSLQVVLQTDPELWADTYDRHVRPLEDTMAEVLSRAVARGELDDAPDPAMVLSFANGAMQQASQRGLLPKDEMVQAILQLLTGGITPDSRVGASS